MNCEHEHGGGIMVYVCREKNRSKTEGVDMVGWGTWGVKSLLASEVGNVWNIMFCDYGWLYNMCGYGRERWQIRGRVVSKRSF